MAEPKPARPPNNAVRVALEGTYHGRPWVNRFWLNVTPSGTPTPATVLGLSNAVAAAFRTRFGPQLSSSWQSSTQRTVMYVSATDEIGVDGVDTGSGGQGMTDAVVQACFLINWSISGSYRGGHPRTYLSGCFQQAFTDEAHLVTANRTALSTAATNFLSDVNALTPTGFSAVQLGTLAFFRNHSALNPPLFKPFTSGSCSPLIATQRRRVGR